jgi:RNA polymerase sigma-70 factor (ECF subfamily)
MNDNILISNIKKGDLYSTELLIKKYKQNIYNLSYKLTYSKTNADDLFQDTWLKIISKINTFNPNYNFKNWAYTICLNQYRDKYNKKKLKNINEKNFTSSEIKNHYINNATSNYKIEDQIIENEKKLEIENYINKLNDKYRIVIILYYFDDLKYKTISEVLNLPIGTIKSRINKAKKELKKMIGDNYE